MTLLRKYLIPIALSILLIVMGVNLLRPAKDANNNDGTGTSLAGKPAPDFALKDLNGKTFHLAALRGKPVVLNFWASWCEPCKDEAPMLSRASKTLSAQGIEVLGIAYNDKTPLMKKFQETYGIGFPLLRDETERIAVDYGLRGVPETFFLNKNGEIISRYFGPLDENILANRVKAIQ